MINRMRRIITELLSFIPDKQFIKMRYFIAFKRKLNLDEPKKYTEKIQWMKLYDRNPLYTKLVDKYEAKKTVQESGLVKVIPTLIVWDSPDEIDFSSLPEEFVLKCTHDSGSVLVFDSKAKYSLEYTKKHFKEAMRRSQYKAGREWAYKNVVPRIIAEPLMRDETSVNLKDYKFFCFDGKAKAMYVATDRGIDNCDVKFDFFDMQFNHLPIKNGHDNSIIPISRPALFDEMKSIAEGLSANYRHVRIDLYEINGDLYFGEFTFYHMCGFTPFTPDYWDSEFGKWLRID